MRWRIVGLLVAFFVIQASVTIPVSAQNTKLPLCGGEGEQPCGLTSWEYIQNGSGVCDYGLKPQFNLFDPDVCVNGTRRMSLDLDGYWEWTLRALKNQRELGVDEPINWVMHIGTHNSYNTLNDFFEKDSPEVHLVNSNHFYSTTDQL
jgi:hypothetical protein